MRSCVVIPARYGSSRYPGKPLVPLLGRPMILWVAELAREAVGQAHVYIATEDTRIARLVADAGFQPLMTSAHALTGTDRLAEAAQQLDYDIFINVQGDEPLAWPEDINRCIAEKELNPSCVINGYCPLASEETPLNHNIPKVIATEEGRMVYMSRSPLPAYKDPACAPERYFKQVCIYGFSRSDLEAFQAFGRKSTLEHSEDIEILRFLDLGIPVKMFETHAGSHAVDIPEDVAPVEAALRARMASCRR